MYPNTKYRILFVSFFLFGLIFAQNSVKSVTDEAVKDYQDGQYASAVDGLKRAIAIIKTKQEQEYTKLLPQALPGWTPGERNFSESDPRGIDKGYIIEQTYNKSDGYIKASLIIDSPMINEVKRMFNSASTPTREGFSFETISNKKALVRYYENQNKGEITILASSSTIAAIYGNNVSLREMQNYARLFNFSEISKVK